MSKGTLEFGLPEEAGEFDAASNAVQWVLAMWDMDEWLRSTIKHSPYLGPDYFLGLQEARDQLCEILQDRGLDLEVLP